MYAKSKIVALMTIGIVVFAIVAIKLIPLESSTADSDEVLRRKEIRLKEENRIKSHFEVADVTWIELPRSYSGVASTKYLKWFPDNSTIIMITTPDDKFVMCVPVKLKDSFTIEALDEYKKAQQDGGGNGE